MGLTVRKKLSLIPVLVYWPLIFVLTHIPVPRAVIKIGASDKTMHFIAYLVLTFLVWFAVNPHRKVNWLRGSAWLVVLVLAIYAGLDEWLQGFVNRNPDSADFAADMTGVVTGLLVLSIIPFWPSALALTAGCIFVLTNFMYAVFEDQLIAVNLGFHFLAYGLFSLLWTRFLYYFLPIKAPQVRWLIGAMALPAGLLVGVELFSALAGENELRLWCVVVAAAAIVLVVAGEMVVALFRRKFRVQCPLGSFEG